LAKISKPLKNIAFESLEFEQNENEKNVSESYANFMSNLKDLLDSNFSQKIMESVRSQITQVLELKAVNFPKTIVFKKEIKLCLGENEVLLPCGNNEDPFCYFKGFVISESKKSKKFELYYGKLYINSSQNGSQESTTIYQGRFVENFIVDAIMKLKNANGLPQIVQNQDKLQKIGNFFKGVAKRLMEKRFGSL